MKKKAVLGIALLGLFFPTFSSSLQPAESAKSCLVATAVVGPPAEVLLTGGALKVALSAVREAVRRLEDATVSFVRPGNVQSESDFNMRGGTTTIVRSEGEYGRQAADWFSFDLPVDASPSPELIVTYGMGDLRPRFFVVVVDGKKIAEERFPPRDLRGNQSFRRVAYRLPESLVAGKKKVTVRFEAVEGDGTGAVFGIRVVRAPEHLE